MFSIQKTNGANREPQEALWICQAKQGDQEAFRLLFSFYQRRLTSYIDHKIHSPADSEDLVQEVFFKAFTNIHALRKDSLKSYLFKIADNVVIDFYRKRKETESNVSLDSLEDNDRIGRDLIKLLAEPRRNAYEIVEKKSFLKFLETRLDEVFEPLEKAVFLAVYHQGLKQRKVAEKFKLPLSTVNNWISRRDLRRNLVAYLLMYDPKTLS